MWTGNPPGAKFLGKTTPLAANAAGTPVLIFGPGYERLFIYTYVAGYASASIAQLFFGVANTVDSVTLSYSASNYKIGTTAASIGMTSQTTLGGLPIASATTTNGRRGTQEVWNPIGDPKFINSRVVTYSNQSPAAAATAQASMDFMMGHWWQNSEAQCVSLTGGGVNLVTGSFISVYGVPRVS